jgi:DUF1707 SHOCT-like domain
VLDTLVAMDPGRIRVSDAEREAIVARLNAATAEGRLTLEEFSDRARRAYESRTWGELARLVDDLPAPQPWATTPATMPTVVARPAADQSDTVPRLALICGIVSIPMGVCVPFGSLVGIAGIVLGIAGLRSTAHGAATHRGTALAGLICGAIGLVVQVALFSLLFTSD